MIDQTFLEQIRKQGFTTKKKVSSIYMGSRSSVRQGRGMELYDHREYYAGDDVRAIDWKVYSRTEKLYIRRFEEEKDFTLHLLVDCSTSMDFSTGGMRKFDYAGSLAAGFAYVALNKNEKFATSLYSNKLLEVMQPRKSKMQFFRTVDMLNDAKQTGLTNLGECMEQYMGYVKTKPFLIVLSDFMEPFESIKQGIYRIARSARETILVQVLDPGELDLKWKEDLNFVDMETDDRERVYISPSFRKEYKKKLDQHVFGIREICDDTGIDFVSVRTDTDLFEAFAGVLEGRRRGSVGWEPEN